MIYAIGLAADGTFAHFVAEAARQRREVRAIDLAQVAPCENWRFALPDDAGSWMSTRDGSHRLDPTAAYYCRLAGISPASDDGTPDWQWHGLITGLASWLDQIPGRIVNRPGAGADNSSKPLHEVVLRRNGFAVPASVTSSSRDRLVAFTAAGATIAKTLSGVRAHARLVTAGDFEDFVPAAGPVHLQRYIAGVDVRVHVCGQAVHAESAHTSAPDYRAADEVRFVPWELPHELTRQLISSTARLGLAFAGWDFKVDGDGNYWCLEVNPMPGYDWYDRRCDGAITRSLLALLSGEQG